MDIKPNAKKPADDAPDAEFSAEVVENVPVARPTTGTAHGNPIAEGISSDTVSDPHEEEMDKVLEEVNKKVKSTAKDDEKPSFLARVFKSSKPQPQQAGAVPGTPKGQPIVTIVLAVVIGAGLITAAYFAFQTDDKTSPAGSTSQATDSPVSDGSSVTTADIDALSQEIQTEVDNLSDDQAFDSGSLSDSTLGL